MSPFDTSQLRLLTLLLRSRALWLILFSFRRRLSFNFDLTRMDLVVSGNQCMLKSEGNATTGLRSLMTVLLASSVDSLFSLSMSMTVTLSFEMMSLLLFWGFLLRLISR